jgi:hypothetical protein
LYIDKQGIIREIDTMVNAAQHGRDVVKKLQELGLAQK